MHDLNEVVEKMGTRQRRNAMMSDSGSWPIPKAPGGDPVNLSFYETKGYLQDTPILRQARGRVATFTKNVRTIRESRMSGTEKQAAITDQVGELIKAIEQAKTKQINETVKAIDERIERYKNQSGDATRQLLDLERAKLKYANVEPDAAIGRLEKMSRDGYTEAELMVVGAKSAEAQKRADEIRNALPPALANADGIAQLDRLNALLSLPTGTINFVIASDDTEVTQSAHVLELIADGETRQTIADLNLAPISEPEGVSV